MIAFVWQDSNADAQVIKFRFFSSSKRYKILIRTEESVIMCKEVIDKDDVQVFATMSISMWLLFKSLAMKWISHTNIKLYDLLC